MKKILILLFVTGILLGPVYAIYCLSFSGSDVGSYQIFSQNVTRAGVGGLSVQSKGAFEWKPPVTVTLSPDMNPIRFLACVDYLPPLGTAGRLYQSNSYAARLDKGDTNIWKRTFTVSYHKPSKSSSSGMTLSYHSQRVNINTFVVQETGEYSFAAQQKGTPELDVSSVKLAIKRNVTQPNQTVVIIGFAILIVSIIGFAIVLKKK